MASDTPLIEFITIGFKPDLVASDPSFPPPQFTKELLPLLTRGITTRWMGPQLEFPGRWTLALRFASLDSHADFFSSEDASKALTGLGGVADLIAPTGPIPLKGGDAVAAVESPCTELFTMYGVEEGILENNLAPFAKVVAEGGLQGFRALAYGPFTNQANPVDDLPAGPALRLVIGWDSMEAHMQHRGEGKLIDNHLHLVEAGNKTRNMYHTVLKKV